MPPGINSFTPEAEKEISPALLGNIQKPISKKVEIISSGPTEGEGDVTIRIVES